jgi:hypothetical protein
VLDIQQREPARKRKSEDFGDFGCIPHEVLERRLIRHRGDNDATLLTPGEFRVFNVLLGQARLIRSNVYDHQEAWTIGGQHIERQRSAQNNYLGKLEAGIKKRKLFYYAKKRGINGVRFESLPKPPARYRSGSVVKPGPAIRAAGKQSYRGAREELKSIPIGSVSMQISYTRILKAARLWKHSYRQVIDAALQRLCQPIGDWPPLIREYGHGKRLQIVVDGWWLPTEDYDKIPYELPTGATALALFLYLRSLSYRLHKRPDYRKATDLKYLCRDILGLPWKGKADAAYKLNAALQAIKNYLERVQTAVPLPACYEADAVVEQGQTKVRFRALSAAQLEVEAAEATEYATAPG